MAYIYWDERQYFDAKITGIDGTEKASFAYLYALEGPKSNAAGNMVHTSMPSDEDMRREMEEAMADGELDGGPTEEKPPSPSAFVSKDEEHQIPASPSSADGNS